MRLAPALCKYGLVGCVRVSTCDDDNDRKILIYNFISV